MHRFCDIRLWKMSWPWNPGQRSLKIIGTDMYRSATYDFLLTFHSNHGPILHRFRDKRRCQPKIPNSSCILCPAEGVPFGNGYRCMGSEKLVMGLLGRTRSLTILQPCGYNPPTWQTDGHQTKAKTALTHSVVRVKKYFIKKYILMQEL